MFDKKLKNLGNQEFNEKNTLFKIEDKDFLFIINPAIYSEKVIQQLKNKKVILVSNKKFNQIIKKNFNCFKIDQLSFENESFALFERKILEKQINQEDLLNQIITSYQQSTQ